MSRLTAAQKISKRIRGLLDMEDVPEAAPRYPKVYEDPNAILAQARKQTVPESPTMKELWGVDRADLRDISRSRKGNIEFQNPADTGKARGSAAGKKVTTRKNANRLVESLGMARDDPTVNVNEGWYVMDPVYQRMLQLMGPDKARQEYVRMNTMTGLMSPRSRVDHELSRGTAARMLFGQGRQGEIATLGSPESADDLSAVPGSIAQQLHSMMVNRYLDKGQLPNVEPKAPAYIAASGTPETGFQTNFAIPDSHYARSIGMPEVRAGGNLDANLSGPEAIDVAPWYNKQVAGKLGMEPVSAQALQWNLYAPATGMRSGIGRPKLEILSDLIAKTARREGISLQNARDRVLLGNTFAGRATPGAMAATAGAAGAGAVGYGLLDE